MSSFNNALMLACAALAWLVLEAAAASLCPPEASGVDVVAGAYSPPGYLKPDTQSLNPDGSLRRQGWSNLRAAARPLVLVCRMASGSATQIRLPDGVQSCAWAQGAVTCE